MLLVVAVCGTLGLDVYRKTGWRPWRFGLLIAAIVWTLLGGVIVFQNHWLAFTPAASVLNGLYMAAMVLALPRSSGRSTSALSIRNTNRSKMHKCSAGL